MLVYNLGNSFLFMETLFYKDLFYLDGKIKKDDQLAEPVNSPTTIW